MQGSEHARQLRALEEAQIQVIGASQQLQTYFELNQHLRLLNEQYQVVIVENDKLIAMMSNQILTQHMQLGNLQGDLQEQKQLNIQLVGQLEAAHDRIADLQRGGRADAAL